MGFLFPWLRGHVGKWLARRIVLPKADHVFVQSTQMREDLVSLGFPAQKFTPVPMGVDLEVARPEAIRPSDDPRLRGKRVAVYLGTLDRPRKIEMLFEMMSIVKRETANTILVIAGGTKDTSYFGELKRRATELNVDDVVIFTGWLSGLDAWSYVRAADVGLSPFPRSPLLDSCSPTKAIEYMAMRLPVIVNDQPDQARAVEESGAGVCVPWNPQAFANALLELLGDPEGCRRMGELGRTYVWRVRGYKGLSTMVAETYRSLVA